MGSIDENNAHRLTAQHQDITSSFNLDLEFGPFNLLRTVYNLTNNTLILPIVRLDYLGHKRLDCNRGLKSLPRGSHHAIRQIPNFLSR